MEDKTRASKLLSTTTSRLWLAGWLVTQKLQLVAEISRLANANKLAPGPTIIWARARELLAAIVASST